ncbi:hypothetical protein Q4Q35_11520 [Flavivirga aquimarina]|uniref:Uncharacterized protein n=1 Tax=Flavivirga aquimarina TaxID=2027862 RepID=A0ABT8WBM0_9FLAO|nr:hypothetical protein [Flavivirga aquimarina]MDO5970434.1 hypothetical protein [Flavivirga aquimarina]
MGNKKRYYKAFIENNGLLNEIEVGRKVGLDENETMKIVSQLLQEHKIKYMEHKASNYSLTKKCKKRNKIR